MLAISGLFENPLPAPHVQSTNKTYRNEQQQQALKWYNQSVSAIISLSQSPNSHDQAQMQIIIVSCILFTSIEIQQAHVANAMHLLKNGFRMIRTYLTFHAKTIPEWIHTILFPMFVRQLVLLAVHGYRPPAEWYEIAEQLLPRFADTPMQSLSEARNQLFALLHLAFELIQDGTPVPHSAAHTGVLRERQQTLLSNIAGWVSNMPDPNVSSSLHTTTDDLATAKSLATHHTLLGYASVAQIWVFGCLDHHYPSQKETPSATHISTFASVLDHTEAALNQTSAIDPPQCSPSTSSLSTSSKSSLSPATAVPISPKPHNLHPIPFTFDIALLPILYFVGWQCRVSSLRHRTLSLLRRAGTHCKQESLFIADMQSRAL